MLCHLLQTWIIEPYNVKHFWSAERYLDLSCSIICSSGNVIEIICAVKNVKCVDGAINFFLISQL